MNETRFTEKHFNSIDLKDRIKMLHDMNDPIFTSVSKLYEQALEQIEILKSINNFEPDQIGIDPHMQIAIFAKKMAKDHLKKIGELDLNRTQHTENTESFTEK